MARRGKYFENGLSYFGEHFFGEMASVDISPKGRSVNGIFGENVLYVKHKQYRLVEPTQRATHHGRQVYRLVQFVSPIPETAEVNILLDSHAGGDI